MTDTLSIFTIASDCILGNHTRRMNSLLSEIQAQRSNEPLSRSANLPWKSERQTHQFEWRKGHKGWLDIIRNDGKFIHAIIVFQYPRLKLFSSPKKDWEVINEVAQALYGEGKTVSTGSKTGKLFEKDKYKILISCFKKNRQPCIEVKMAREYFL